MSEVLSEKSGRSATPSPAPSDDKTRAVRAACEARDIPALRALADSEGGFRTDTLRRLAWPVLLGASSPADDSNDTTPPPTTEDWRQLPRHKDEDQVKLDVQRSFVYYPDHRTEAELEARKIQLSDLITSVLRRYPFLCYFQGFHDICQVFLLVFHPAPCADLVARLSVLRIRDFMLHSLAATTTQLALLPDILDVADPKLRRHLDGVKPFYALSGTLTMYAHDITSYSDIARLFDVLLAREPVFSVYMFAQIVMDRRDEILTIDEGDMLYVVLSKVPGKLDLDRLVADSVDLFERCPPNWLRSWSSLSSASSLKTARNVEQCARQTMEQGHDYFIRQTKELQWMQLRNKAKSVMWYYRRPLGAVGTAFVAVVLGLYLRRSPASVVSVFSLFSR